MTSSLAQLTSATNRWRGNSGYGWRGSIRHGKCTANRAKCRSCNEYGKIAMMTPEEQSELIRIIQRAQLTISEAFWINALLERLKPQEPKKAETPQS